eukprot:RCo010444
MQEVAVVCTDGEQGGSAVYIDVHSEAQLYAHPGNACLSSHGCVFSETHDLLLTAQRGKDAILVNHPARPSGRLYHTAERVECLAVSRDGVYLAGGTPRGHVMIWQLTTGELLRLFP